VAITEYIEAIVILGLTFVPRVMAHVGIAYVVPLTSQSAAVAILYRYAVRADDTTGTIACEPACRNGAGIDIGLF
jgi:hypothetical protein